MDVAARLDRGTYDANELTADLAQTARLSARTAFLVASEAVDAISILANPPLSQNVVFSDELHTSLDAAVVTLTRLLWLDGDDPAKSTSPPLGADVVMAPGPAVVGAGTSFKLRADATGYAHGLYLGEVTIAAPLRTEEQEVEIVVTGARDRRRPHGSADRAGRRDAAADLHVLRRRRLDRALARALAGGLPRPHRGYRRACVDVIEGRFEGHIVHYKGDGVMSAFGYPVAHENDAERAVRAGLALGGPSARCAAPRPASRSRSASGSITATSGATPRGRHPTASPPTSGPAPRPSRSRAWSWSPTRSGSLSRPTSRSSGRAQGGQGHAGGCSLSASPGAPCARPRAVADPADRAARASRLRAAGSGAAYGRPAGRAHPRGAGGRQVPPGGRSHRRARRRCPLAARLPVSPRRGASSRPRPARSRCGIRTTRPGRDRLAGLERGPRRPSAWTRHERSRCWRRSWGIEPSAGYAPGAAEGQRLEEQVADRCTATWSPARSECCLGETSTGSTPRPRPARAPCPATGARS